MPGQDLGNLGLDSRRGKAGDELMAQGVEVEDPAGGIARREYGRCLPLRALLVRRRLPNPFRPGRGQVIAEHFGSPPVPLCPWPKQRPQPRRSLPLMDPQAGGRPFFEPRRQLLRKPLGQGLHVAPFSLRVGRLQLDGWRVAGEREGFRAKTGQLRGPEPRARGKKVQHRAIPAGHLAEDGLALPRRVDQALQFPLREVSALKGRLGPRDGRKVGERIVAGPAIAAGPFAESLDRRQVVIRGLRGLAPLAQQPQEIRNPVAGQIPEAPGLATVEDRPDAADRGCHVLGAVALAVHVATVSAEVGNRALAVVGDARAACRTDAVFLLPAIVGRAHAPALRADQILVAVLLERVALAGLATLRFGHQLAEQPHRGRLVGRKGRPPPIAVVVLVLAVPVRGPLPDCRHAGKQLAVHPLGLLGGDAVAGGVEVVNKNRPVETRHREVPF